MVDIAEKVLGNVQIYPINDFLFGVMRKNVLEIYKISNGGEKEDGGRYEINSIQDMPPLTFSISLIPVSNSTFILQFRNSNNELNTKIYAFVEEKGIFVEIQEIEGSYGIYLLVNSDKELKYVKDKLLDLLNVSDDLLAVVAKYI